MRVECRGGLEVKVSVRGVLPRKIFNDSRGPGVCTVTRWLGGDLLRCQVGALDQTFLVPSYEALGIATQQVRLSRPCISLKQRDGWELCFVLLRKGGGARAQSRMSINDFRFQILLENLGMETYDYILGELQHFGVQAGVPQKSIQKRHGRNR